MPGASIRNSCWPACKHGAMRYSVRYDRFDMQQTYSTYDDFPILLADHGHAWTLACMRELNRHWSLALEGIQSDSTRAAAHRATASLPTRANRCCSWPCATSSSGTIDLRTTTAADRRTPAGEQRTRYAGSGPSACAR